MRFLNKETIARIPFSVEGYILWSKLLFLWKNEFISRITAKNRTKYLNQIFYDRKKISKRNGPVILVSRDIAYTFPLSYAYLAGYLKEKEINVIVLFRDINQEELVRKIMKLKPILVGFGNLYPELEEIKSIIYKLNKAGRDFPIVLGGQMFSPIPEFALKLTTADFGVIGEGEIILYQLVKALKNNTDITQIGGLAIRTRETVRVNEGGQYIEDLSKLPKIPYDFFDVDKWLQIGRWYAQYRPEQPHWRFNDRVINVHGGRGCPFKCNFCYHHNKPRYRNIDNMMDEAEKALKQFNANMLYFSDDLVIATPLRVRELIKRIKKLKYPISYSVSTRFDILERLDDSLLRELKESGCRIMALGIESGSDRILKIIGKNTTAKGILKGLKRLKKVGILPSVSVMVGQLSETREDVIKSLELVKKSIRIDPLIAYGFSITTPFPGSILYNMIFQKRLLKDDEDFYNRYVAGRVGDWNQVVNLSAMSDIEVIKMRNMLDESYRAEQRKVLGIDCYNSIKKISYKQSQLASRFENKTHAEKKKIELTYCIEQKKLEKDKLDLMGVV